MPEITIAQSQINPTVGDLAGNLDLILRDLERARELGAQVVTFPELAICGYPPEDLLIKPRFVSDCARSLEKLLPRGGRPDLRGGLSQKRERPALQRGRGAADGRIKAEYLKMELPNYEVLTKKRYFSPGQTCLLLDIDGGAPDGHICEDVWIKGNLLERTAKEYGVQACLNISASPFHMGKYILRRDRIMGGFARRTGAWMLHNNLVGGQDELIFDGGSVVIDPKRQRGRLRQAFCRRPALLRSEA